MSHSLLSQHPPGWVALWLALFTGTTPVLCGSTAQASLAVRVDAGGRARVAAFVAASLPKPEALATAVGATMGRNLREIDLDVEEFKKVVTLTADIEQPFPHTLTHVSGAIDLKPLADYLRSVGVHSLAVRFVHPRSPRSACSSAKQIERYPAVEYYCALETSQEPVPRLAFDFGYSASDWLVFLGPAVGILLLPAGLALRRRRVSSSAAGTASAPGLPSHDRFLVWLSLATWLSWGAMVYALKGDESSWFLFGCDSVWTQAVAVVGAFVVPPLAIMILCTALSAGGGLGSAAQYNRGSSAGTSLNRVSSRPCRPWQLLRSATVSQSRFAAPVALAAIGIAFLREGASSKGHEWLAVAVAAFGVAAGLAHWIDSADAEPENAAPGADRRIERRAALPGALLSLAIMVLTPALAVGFVGRGRFSDDWRMLLYAAGLAVTLGLVRVTHSLRERWRLARLPALPGRETFPALPVAGFSLLVQPFIVGVVAWVLCKLFEFPFELTRGDEGWALLLISVSTAVIQALLHWLRTLPGRNRPTA